MTRTQIFRSTLAAAFALPTMMIAGCEFEMRAHPDAVVVQDAPPPQVVYEDPTPQPEVGVIWIQPEYVQIGGRYELRHGYWRHPPQGRTRWVASHYEHRSGGYAYVGGRWD